VATAEDELDRLLRDRHLLTVFQQVVHLASESTVGYEALVRPPPGSLFTSADELLHSAYRGNRVVEFDWVARACACRAAVSNGLPPDQLLFMNVEPLAVDSECPADLWPDIREAWGKYQVILEVTERSLDRDPGTLLDGIDRLRHIVTGLALDDVGANPTTVSMLPIVAPAIIKLDMDMTLTELTPEKVRVLDVVYEETERTGAAILAEGIETSAQLEHARELGAVLGQGNHIGPPLPRGMDAGNRPRQSFHLRTETPRSILNPFDALEGRVIGLAPAELLVALTQQMGSCGDDPPRPSLHIIHVPHPELFGSAERERMERLAELGALTAVLGPGIPHEPGGGIRGIGFRREPELVGEWAVIVLGPCAVEAMLARSIPGNPHVFEYGITHDRRRVIAAARCLLRRMGAPEPTFQLER
jgi:EAL domain-containing protein (putative c-di-GMP-specific phosphodiesterase class I)